MTFSEIVKEYKKVFILLVEKAGRETGNTSYQNIESILGSSKFRDVITDEQVENGQVDFQIVVCSYMVALFCDIYGIDKIKEWGEDMSHDKLEEFYQTYLKKATISFCQKYGIPEITKIESSFILINL